MAMLQNVFPNPLFVTKAVRMKKQNKNGLLKIPGTPFLNTHLSQTSILYKAPK